MVVLTPGRQTGFPLSKNAQTGPGAHLGVCSVISSPLVSE